MSSLSLFLPIFAHFASFRIHTRATTFLAFFSFFLASFHQRKKVKLTIYDKDEEEIARKQKALCRNHEDESTKAFMFLNHLMNVRVGWGGKNSEENIFYMRRKTFFTSIRG
jgi:hypothetical protein